MYTVGADIAETDVSKSSGERPTPTSDEAKADSSAHNDSSSSGLTETLTCHQTVTADAATGGDDVHVVDDDTGNAKGRKGDSDSDTDNRDDDDDVAKNDVTADDNYTDAEDDEQVCRLVVQWKILLRNIL